MQFTEDQKKVIETRNKNILVSAAAGSGKTAVLVQRILSRITGKDPIDIDRLLIVTFTSAAAAEMRERIHAALLQAQTEHPEDENLQRQAALIHNAQITTIDSYCMFLLRNHFHEIDLDPSFRIGDQGEFWAKGVLDQIRRQEIPVSCRSGINRLRIYSVTPGFVLEKLLIRPEGTDVPESYLGPKETYHT